MLACQYAAATTSNKYSTAEKKYWCPQDANFENCHIFIDSLYIVIALTKLACAKVVAFNCLLSFFSVFFFYLLREAQKSDYYQESEQEKKQITDTKNKIKKIKSDNKKQYRKVQYCYHNTEVKNNLTVPKLFRIWLH